MKTYWKEPNNNKFNSLNLKILNKSNFLLLRKILKIFFLNIITLRAKCHQVSIEIS